MLIFLKLHAKCRSLATFSSADVVLRNSDFIIRLQVEYLTCRYIAKIKTFGRISRAKVRWLIRNGRIPGREKIHYSLAVNDNG